MGESDGQARDATYVVAGCTPWARRVFDQRLSKLPGEWTYVETPLALEESVRAFAPRLVFVLHWRWRVPPEVLEATECIGFHLGSFGRYRGGTPLQHQILDARSEARLTVYRMTQEIDAGPVYGTPRVELHGSAEAIYARALKMASYWIEEIAGRRPMQATPPEHLGPLRSRRTSCESRLPEDPDADPEAFDASAEMWAEDAYDFIRMLDAAGYPHAFLDYGPYRLTFRRAVLYDGRVECDCTITVREDAV